MLLQRIIQASLLYLTFNTLLCAQVPGDFSGRWHQVNERCVPQPRNKMASYGMNVDVADNALNVHITSDNGKGEKKLDVRYEIGGRETTYTGMDGDEFHTRVTWEADHFVFNIVEHERGHEIRSTETWWLADDGKALKRVKQGEDDGRHINNIYILERR